MWHLRVASCGLTSDFSVVFALLIVEAKTSLVVELFWSPFLWTNVFCSSVSPFLGPGKVCSMSHCYVWKVGWIEQNLCGVFLVEQRFFAG